MRSTFVIAALGAVLAVGVASAQQGGPPGSGRAAGTVKSVTPTDVVLTTASGEVDLAVTPQTRVVVRKAADASEISPGAYLGTSNQDGAAPGTGTATEVHIMDNGPNVNYPMNQSGLTMTNGHVTNVTKTEKGQEMDIDYGQDAKRHVVVTKDTAMTRMVDVGIAGLKPGAEVTALTGAPKDGKPSATFIMIGSSAAK